MRIVMSRTSASIASSPDQLDDLLCACRVPLVP